MGGGSSMGTSVEELLTTTYMIGRAIAAISCPGMYRLYDFHSSKAPKLKNAKQSFSMFGEESDDDEWDDGEAKDPLDYEHFFSVQLGEDTIYLEDPLTVNEAGWNALHTCCMSFLTVPAGLKIIDEMVRQNGSLDKKTLYGPGSFNKGWTALHMACAYGVEPLAERLIKEGADVNTQNCYGYTPLLDACHRGFTTIVEFLINAGVDLSFVPPEDLSKQSPFVSAPAACALGEAARCGFHKIVEKLISAGANIDQQNSLGWSPLHEASFYNRADVVKTLLLNGASASLRSKSGAMPYHLASLMVIRQMLTDMGGPDAVPQEGDTIDMVAVLNELTSAHDPEDGPMAGDTTMIIQADADGLHVIQPKSSSGGHVAPRNSTLTHAPMSSHVTDDLEDGESKDARLLLVQGESKGVGSNEGATSTGTSPKSRKKKMNNATNFDVKEATNTPPALLHSGGMLGDLPALSGGKATAANRRAVDASMGTVLGVDDDGARVKKESLLAQPKEGAGEKKKKKKKMRDGVPPDMPSQYLCQLSQRPMSEPVKSCYGHVFDSRVIMDWLKTRGKICPLTGAPLSEVDLKPIDGLADEIRGWLLNKSKGNSTGKVMEIPEEPPTKTATSSTSADTKNTSSAEDDIYDF